MADKKIPWVAAVLNAVTFGLGYIYLGKRTNFGKILFASWLLAVVDIFIYGSPGLSLLGYISGYLTLGALAYDAYTLAQENMKKKR